jgi:hypothetical protein
LRNQAKLRIVTGEALPAPEIARSSPAVLEETPPPDAEPAGAARRAIDIDFTPATRRRAILRVALRLGFVVLAVLAMTQLLHLQN